MPARTPPAVLDGFTLPEDAPSARIVMMGRPGCHLCDDAQTVITHSGQAAAIIDVDAHADLRPLFTDHVPVVYVDGHLLSMWWLDADALTAALDR